MRIATAVLAAASALLFAASQAHAAPLINLQSGAQAPAGLVDLVAKGGGGGRSYGGMRGSRGSFGVRPGGGAKFSRPGGSAKFSRGDGRSYSGRNYAGRSYRGGSYARGGNYGRYAYRGRSYGNYGRYAYKGNKGRYYRRTYPYFWGGLALSGAYGYYGSNCGWLYRQAQATGSAYWWNRYQDCVYAY
jgi:hypothetical protein